LQAINGIIVVLNLKNWKKSECEKQLEEWKQKTLRDIQGEKQLAFKPYCGIVIHYLEKKLRQS